MKSIGKLSILVFLCLQFQLSNAQGDFKPGFIETNKSGTVKGLVRVQAGIGLNFSCNFKEKINSEELKFLPFEIVSYGYDSGMVFFSKKILLGNDSVVIFANRIIPGKAELFEVLNRLFIQKDGRFIELINEEINGSKEYLDVLNRLLKDCKKVENRIRSSTLIENWRDFVVSTVEMYNNCYEPRNRKLELKLNYSPLVGINPSVFSFQESGDPDLKFFSTQSFHNSRPLFFGIDLDIRKTARDKSAFIVSAWYLSYQIKYSGYNGKEFNELSYSSNKLGFLLGYRFALCKLNKLKFEGNVRPGILYNLSSQGERLQEVDNSGIIYSNSTKFSDKSIAMIYSAGVGVSYPIHRSSFFAALNYGYSSSQMQFPDSSSNLIYRTSTLFLFIGLKF